MFLYCYGIILAAYNVLDIILYNYTGRIIISFTIVTIEFSVRSCRHTSHYEVPTFFVMSRMSSRMHSVSRSLQYIFTVQRLTVAKIVETWLVSAAHSGKTVRLMYHT
jgi:hypothetical protein